MPQVPTLAWHRAQGGHMNHERSPAKHALRLLREAVELTIASGASIEEVKSEVLEELRSQHEKGAFDNAPTREGIAGEVADVGLLLDIFVGYQSIQLGTVIATKMEVNFQRKWAADEFGVLWRPEVLEARRSK